MKKTVFKNVALFLTFIQITSVATSVHASGSKAETEYFNLKKKDAVPYNTTLLRVPTQMYEGKFTTIPVSLDENGLPDSTTLLFKSLNMIAQRDQTEKILPVTFIDKGELYTGDMISSEESRLELAYSFLKEITWINGANHRGPGVSHVAEEYLMEFFPRASAKLSNLRQLEASSLKQIAAMSEYKWATHAFDSSLKNLEGLTVFLAGYTQLHATGRLSPELDQKFQNTADEMFEEASRDFHSMVSDAFQKMVIPKVKTQKYIEGVGTLVKSALFEGATPEASALVERMLARRLEATTPGLRKKVRDIMHGRFSSNDVMTVMGLTYLGFSTVVPPLAALGILAIAPAQLMLFQKRGLNRQERYLIETLIAEDTEGYCSGELAGLVQL